MKNKVFLAVFCLLAVSCSNESEDKVMNQQALAPVTVSVNAGGKYHQHRCGEPERNGRFLPGKYRLACRLQ